MSFKVYVINEAESLKKDDVRAAVKAIALQVRSTLTLHGVSMLGF